MMDDNIRELHIKPGHPLTDALLACSESGEFLCLVLPNQKRVYVHTEDTLRHLGSIMADPDIAALLAAADDDHAESRGVTLEAGETPRDLAIQALGSPALADLLDSAADDFNSARGEVMDRSARPNNECVSG